MRVVEPPPSSRPRLLGLWLASAALSAPLAGCAIDQSFGKSGTETSMPDINVDPGQLIFERVPFGEDEVKPVTISNIGTAALNVAGVRVEQSSAFTVLGDLPVTIPGGESITVDVIYSPTSDEDVGYAYVDSNDPDTPNATVELIGTSGSPRLIIDPPAHDFGTLPVYCRNSVTHSLTNEGTADLTISGIYETGEGFGLGTEVTLPVTLAPGEAIEVDVNFEALLPANLTGSLWVESNDPGGLREARHSGLGDEDGVCLAVPPGGEADVDLEFVAEYKMADIAFVLDTTCSMSSFANQVASSFTGIAAEVAVRIPDVTFGAATFDDYNYSNGGEEMGSGADLPWILRQQQTSDIGLVNSALASVAIHNGADWPESTFEALFQASSGRGFDQDCDGSLDASDDVPPFIASPSDAFGGVVGEVYDPEVEGTGEFGGMGFREDVLPIIIYATDAEMRDPDAGYRVPGEGSCNPGAAGFSAATSALNAIGAKAIGVAVNAGTSGMPYTQMTDVAVATDTWGDFDGNGIDEPGVLLWNSGDLTEKVADAIERTVDSAVFDEVRLYVVFDEFDFVRSITPELYEDVPSGEDMPFNVEFNGAVPSEANDRTYPLVFALEGKIGDVELVLDRFTVHVLVPGG